MSGATEVRLASEAELPRVGQLHFDFNTEFGDPVPDPEWLGNRYRELVAGGDTDVLVLGTPPLGFAALRYRPAIYYDGPEAYLAELYIAPPERGHGLGRALMEGVLDRARERGARYIDLNTSETDTVAIALYESLGFSRTEGRPDGPVCFYFERDL
jgi:ribosomal protein S18 acetylase RimI-like enzyme